MGAEQYWGRPQRGLCSPRHTLSKYSDSTSVGASVKTPASKLRRVGLFIPMPAPVGLQNQYMPSVRQR